MSEQNELVSDPCRSSEEPEGTRLPAKEGGTCISPHLEADEERKLSVEEEAKILERLRALGYL